MIRLLIVEDSPVSSYLLERMFESDPEISVIGTVSTGESALQFIENDMPDVITVNIQLPDMDGFETTRRIMSICPVPIVAITRTAPKEDVAGFFRAIDSGAVAVIRKPDGLNGATYAQCAEKLVDTVKDMARLMVGSSPAGSLQSGHVAGFGGTRNSVTPASKYFSVRYGTQSRGAPLS
ncbi:MAG: response regulator [Thermodesulfobacteriota bacterium]